MTFATSSPLRQLVEKAILRNTSSAHKVRRPFSEIQSYRSVKIFWEQLG